MDYSNFAPQAQPYHFFVPTKPGPPYTSQEEPQYNPLDAFSNPTSYQSFFDHNATYPAPSLIPPAPAQSPPLALHHQPSMSHPPPLPQEHSLTPLPPEMNAAEIEYEQAQGRSSDEEKESLTPQQSRRKAQNRAAQRAFRERKERHVKDLELKLKSMEARSTDLMSDNERLKRELNRVATQNEILRATSSSSHNTGGRSSSSTARHHHHHHHHPPPETATADDTGDTAGMLPDDSTITPIPTVYSPRTFSAAFAEHNVTADGGLIANGIDDPITHRIAINSATGERLLSTGAAWDYIQQSELYQRGVVDLGEVVDRLKERVVCDGAGPSFLEGEVRKAIEESMGAVGDELI